MSLDPIEGFEGEGAGDRAPSTDPECPRCGSPFQPRRKNQRYCTTDCQKKASRHAARGSVSAGDSAERRYVKRRQRATLAWLNETFYATPPGARLGLLKVWLDAARGEDAHMRAVLTRRDFMDRAAKHNCHRNSRAYPPVPFLADRFAQRHLGCRVWEWVTGQAPEPETGEVVAGSVVMEARAGKIHPHPCADSEPALPVYIERDPAEFLGRIRAMRLEASQDRLAS